MNDLFPFHAESKAGGADTLEALELRFYKRQETVVQDNFGWRLCYSIDFGAS